MIYTSWVQFPAALLSRNIGKLSLGSSGVAKLSTCFGWYKGGILTTAGWRVTLFDPFHMACEFPIAVKAKLMLTAIHCLLTYLLSFPGEPTDIVVGESA